MLRWDKVIPPILSFLAGSASTAFVVKYLFGRYRAEFLAAVGIVRPTLQSIIVATYGSESLYKDARDGESSVLGANDDGKLQGGNGGMQVEEGYGLYNKDTTEVEYSLRVDSAHSLENDYVQHASVHTGSIFNTSNKSFGARHHNEQAVGHSFYQTPGEDIRQWLAYWVFYSAFLSLDKLSKRFSLFDSIGTPFHSPAVYDICKVLILLWMQGKSSRGALTLYNYLIRPILPPCEYRNITLTEVVPLTSNSTTAAQSVLSSSNQTRNNENTINVNANASNKYTSNSAITNPINTTATFGRATNRWDDGQTAKHSLYWN
ncbi:hypothetical protein AX774_g4178 [Zancudomyces culisetae]|uniref:Uncharacterized protein n=1 Tax=Zancudomyces culisetae TaxID=1213189 RepID=A0A1R1PN65_ZANCU|nr:hypothetical protein AX774_g4178 [Zancudomyces culisetae]|eukprot:OMH82342.1 hypothetical protein AX774_g4178 [Zancudomyces culisetae]